MTLIVKDTKERSKVKYGSLGTGKCFLYNDCIYLKTTNLDSGEIMDVELMAPEGDNVNFSECVSGGMLDNDLVVPVVATINSIEVTYV